MNLILSSARPSIYTCARTCSSAVSAEIFSMDFDASAEFAPLRNRKKAKRGGGSTRLSRPTCSFETVPVTCNSLREALPNKRISFFPRDEDFLSKQRGRGGKEGRTRTGRRALLDGIETRPRNSRARDNILYGPRNAPPFAFFETRTAATPVGRVDCIEFLSVDFLQDRPGETPRLRYFVRHSVVADRLHHPTSKFRNCRSVTLRARGGESSG